MDPRNLESKPRQGEPSQTTRDFWIGKDHLTCLSPAGLPMLAERATASRTVPSRGPQGLPTWFFGKA